MKKEDVPQEVNTTIGNSRKVMYAQNERGVFERVNYGSSIEEFATKTAVNEYAELKKESLLKIKLGLSSPLEYFMYKSRMDIQTLASIVGMFQFRVKRHLKAKNFEKLDDKILSKYADAFSIKLEELKGFSNE